MSIATSNFKLSGRNPKALSIANGQRNYRDVPKYRPLVPPWWLVKQGDEVVFRVQYIKQLRWLDPRKVLEEIGDDAVLLCWCKPGEFCHRRMVAKWLELETGIVVPELEVEVEEPKLMLPLSF